MMRARMRTIGRDRIDDHANLAAVIAKALGGSRSGEGWIARCPAHLDKTPSLSIAPGSIRPVVLRCFAGCSFEEVRDALRDLGLWPDGDGPRLDPVELARRIQAREEERRRLEAERVEIARRLWDAAKPIRPGDLAETYLRRRRGFNLLQWPPCLRLGSYTSKAGASWPALIAAATGALGFGQGAPASDVRAVQVTPLASDGRPAWSDPKRVTRGVVKGASVKVTDRQHGAPIVVVEGVEDALAIRCIHPGINVWAVLGVENAATVELPDFSDVILCLDGDEAGAKAAVRAWDALTRGQHKVSRVGLPRGLDPAKAFEGGRGHA